MSRRSHLMAIQVSCCMFLNFTSQPPSIVWVPSLNWGIATSHKWPWSLTCRGRRWGCRCWPWQICRGADGCEVRCGCYRCLLWSQDLTGEKSANTALLNCSSQKRQECYWLVASHHNFRSNHLGHSTYLRKGLCYRRLGPPPFCLLSTKRQTHPQKGPEQRNYT